MLSSIFESIKKWPELRPRWWLDLYVNVILGELLLLLLPLMILWFINFFFSGIGLGELAKTVDFSLVVVSVHAAALAGFIHLKVNVQSDTSERLFGGAKYLSILLVFSSIVLTLTLLDSLQILDLASHKTWIAGVNQALLLIGVFVVVLSNWHQVRVDFIRDHALYTSKQAAFIEIRANFDEALDLLIKSKYVMSLLDNLPFEQEDSADNSVEQFEIDALELRGRLKTFRDLCVQVDNGLRSQ